VQETGLLLSGVNQSGCQMQILIGFAIYALICINFAIKVETGCSFGEKVAENSKDSHLLVGDGNHFRDPHPFLRNFTATVGV
jgi:hypothetical protein